MKDNFGNNKCKEITENQCPYCNEHLLMNKRTFANHVRWCTCNPKYKQIRLSTTSKVSTSLKNKFNEKHGQLKEFKVNCKKCGKEFIVKEFENDFPTKEYYFCSRSCANSRQHSDETKNKIRNTLKKDRSLYEKNCEYCGKQFTTYNIYQKCCCNSCASHNKYKTTNIRKLYKRLCGFNFALNSYPNEFDFDLINKYGWYQAKNHGDNPNGVSRDHCYSIDEGFKNLVDPYIISHPANCVLIQQRKNASKYTKCNISIEDLIEKIKQWNEKYGEYENKIDYIGIYNLGIKFNITFNK